MTQKYIKHLTNVFILSLLAGCAGEGEKSGFRPHVRPAMTTDQKKEYDHPGRVFGDNALTFTSGGKKKDEPSEYGIGVNTYLWHATLETLSFMPLKTVEPFGGVVVTDWYTSPQTPNERLKVNVIILDRQLRADALKVSIFHEKYDEAKKNWASVDVSPETVDALEESILSRAREMRVQSKAK